MFDHDEELEKKHHPENFESTIDPEREEEINNGLIPGEDLPNYTSEKAEEITQE